MREKNQRVGKYWKHDHPLFNGYQIDPQSLQVFTDKHPKVVKAWLSNEAQQEFIPDQNHKLTAREKKHRWAMKLEGLSGAELSKKHFRVIR
jgi:hypothetical protein